MDIVSDILQLSGVKNYLLHNQVIQSPWQMKFPCNKSIAFHVVTKGELILKAKKFEKPKVLRQGDIVFLTRGFDHSLSSNAAATESILISGAYQLLCEPIHPLFFELPDYFILSSVDIERHSPINTVLSLISQEMALADIGSTKITKNLLDVMFNYILREILKQKGINQTWSGSISDPLIFKVLNLLHENLTHNWSLNELAEKSGISRSGLASKFKNSLGDTPLNYLSKLRIQKASNLLISTDLTIEQISHSLGYNDSFVFSKNFKKNLGQNPSEYRKKYKQYYLGLPSLEKLDKASS